VNPVTISALYSLSSTISVAFATFFIIILIFRSGIMIISCEKLNDEDIQKVKKKDAIYTCTSINDKKKTTLAIAKRSEEYSKAHKLTLAEDLLVEEFEQRCQACNNSIQNGGDTCNVCLMQFHESCLNVDNNTCFGCIGKNRPK
jgi:hypothetical protein